MSRTLLAVLALLVAMVSFQIGASLAKQLFPLVGPVGTTTLRLVFGALILCAIWRPWRQKLTRAELRTIAIYGVAMGGMNLCFYIALKTVPLGIGVAILSGAFPYSLEMIGLKRLPTHTFGVLMSVEPALGAVIGCILLHEKLALLQIIAIACVIAASVGSTLSSRRRAPVSDV